jgi:molybdopterin-guanine dinucleotide biosynthesis protein A
MVEKPDITGLILAGGAGRRVGNRDKGLIPWRGMPLISHVSERLKPQVSKLLISCNRNFSLYEAFSEDIIADTRQHFQGPLAGLETASSYIRTDFLVVVGCDMPRIPEDLVSRLIVPFSDHESESPEISYAHDGVRAQYLCAVIRRSCLTSLTRYLDDGNRAVRDWYKTRQTVEVDFSDCRSSFENHNRLE